MCRGEEEEEGNDVVGERVFGDERWAYREWLDGAAVSSQVLQCGSNLTTCTQGY